MSDIPSKKYAWCNHYHELTDSHSIVEIGGSKFVANKKAVPLLKALNNVELKTTSHHIDKPEDNSFIQVSMENIHTVEIRDDKLTIQWEQLK